MLISTPLVVLTTLLSGTIASSGYAPTSATCPSSLVRLGSAGLSKEETAFATARKAIADAALIKWLKKTNPALDTSGVLPTLGLAVSGGGLRAMLTGAGVLQALDSADSNVSTSGLYQAMSYHSALSGGSWLTSSLADNNYPTVSSLLTSKWTTAFSNGLLAPNGLLTLISYADIAKDIIDKEDAGFTITFTDIWARLLGYQLLTGSDGGEASTLSGITGKSNFVAHQVPYPILTSLNNDLTTGSCVPGWNASVWEFTPYEYGSWSSAVNAFAQSKYMGTSVSNGAPANSTCVNGFDSLSFVLGTSSQVFNDIAYAVTSLAGTFNSLCSAAADVADVSSFGKAIDALETLFPSIKKGLATAVDAFYALYPNPFYKLTSATEVSALKTLHMVDGGESGQTTPIFPHLLPARHVDLLIANDNNGDYPINTIPSYPNGTAIYATYVAAVAQGLTRMPVVPSPDAYLSNYTAGHPIFFGCKDKSVTTIVWVPNAPVNFASGIATFQISLSSKTTPSMVANGNAMMSRTDSKEWAICLACAIMDAGALKVPASCESCFQQYCYAG